MATITPVDIGLTADDGTGDPLRTAFGKLNTNMSAVNVELVELRAEFDVQTHTVSEITDAGNMVAANFADTDEALIGTSEVVGMTPAASRAQTATQPYLDGRAAADNITVITNDHAGKWLDIDQNMTIDSLCAPYSADVWRALIVRNAHATLSRTLTMEAGGGGTGTINGSSVTPHTLPAGGVVSLLFTANPLDQPVVLALGDTAFADLGIGDGTTFENAAATLTALGVSTFFQTLLDDANAAAVFTTLGISAYAQTLLDDAAAGNALTTLGVSSFAQTVLDDTTATAARTTLAAAGSPLTAALDCAGFAVGSNLSTVATAVSGTLTAATHSGKTLVISGNITVPNAAGDVGMHATVIAGGAYTITFNSTVTGAAVSGQICSFVVQSTTVIKVTPWLTTQTLS